MPSLKKLIEDLCNQVVIISHFFNDDQHKCKITNTISKLFLQDLSISVFIMPMIMKSYQNR